MITEEYIVGILDIFANYKYLPQEPKLKQALDKYILLKPRATDLSHNMAALIDVY